MKNVYLLSGVLILTMGVGFIFINREYLSPQKEAKALLLKGKLFLEQDSDEAMRKAIEEFTTVASHFPDTAQAKEAIFRLAESYERLGMRDVALSKYRKLIEQKLPDDLLEDAKFKIAKLQIMRSYTDEGVAQLMQLLAITKSPKMRSEVYTELGRYYAKEGKVAAAQKNYQIALSEYADNKEAKILLAKSLTQQGKDAQAYGVYEDYLTFQGSLDASSNKAVEQDYRNDALAQGLQYMQQGKNAEAIKLFETVASRFPDTAEADNALYFMGNAYMKTGDYIKAIQTFNKAVGNTPRNRDEASFVKKGEAYYHRKDYKKAAAIFEYVKKNYPKGKYYQIASDWAEESLRSLTEGSELKDEENQESQENLTETFGIQEPMLESEFKEFKREKTQPKIEPIKEKTISPKKFIEQTFKKKEPTLEDDAKIAP